AVEASDVRSVPGEEPCGKCVARPDAPRAVRVEPSTHSRSETEEDEERRDVGDEGVLQQVDEEQALGRDRLERRVECSRDENETQRIEPRPPRRRTVVARRPCVGGGGGGSDTEERVLEAEAGGAHAVATRAWRSRGRMSRKTNVPSTSSCSAIITIPASFWSPSAEKPYAPRYSG